MLPSNNGNSYIGQIVNVSPNTEYTLKTYIKTNAADAKVNLCIRGGTESQMQANAGDVLFDEKYGGADWTPVEVTFNSGSHSFVLVSLVKWEENTASSVYRNPAYIDNVSLKLANPELMVNGDFENGNNSWRKIGTAAISNNMWEGEYIAYEGQYYGMLPSQTNNAALYQTLELKANTTYNVKAKVAVQTGGEVIFAVKTPDLSGHYPGGTIETKIEGTGLSWVDFEYEFTTKTQTSVAVAFIKWSDTTSGGVYNGQVYIDNVSLKEVSKEVEELLRRMKSEREEKQINDFGWVWYTPYITEEECINNGTLNDWCKKAGEMIGIPTLHNHDLRHSGSNILKELGMDIQDIAELLHHESTETTIKHYLTVNKKKVKDNKDKFVF